MTSSPIAQPFGSFNNRALCGFFNQTIESSFPTTTTFGMNINFMAPNTTVKDEDGNIWNITRYFDPNNATGITFGTNKGGRKMYQQIPEVAQAYRGMVMNVRDDHSHTTVGIMQDPNLEPFSYRRQVDSMAWSEGKLLSLTGTTAAPALSWYMPTEQGGLMFTSYVSKVEGTVMGRRCEGFSEFATHWCAPGVSWLMEYSKVAMAWLIICNEYTDGSRDLCHVGFCLNDLRFALMASEQGPRLVTTDVEMEVELDEGRYPKTLDWKIGDERWHWEGEPSGDMGDPARGIERGREGIARRVGDTRELKLAYGWVSFMGDSRIDPYIRSR